MCLPTIAADSQNLRCSMALLKAQTGGKVKGAWCMSAAAVPAPVDRGAAKQNWYNNVTRGQLM
jgi:hypothetical protein